MPEAQAEFSWLEPTGTLGDLVARAHTRARAAWASRQSLEAAVSGKAEPPSFAGALRAHGTVSVIAEVKRKSPSRGGINPDINAVERARAYAKGGATAISVLTEPDSFGGSLDDLAKVSAAVALPTLRKDFIIDDIQLLEARASGAAAALLIARALRPGALESLVSAARQLGIEPLVEIRDESELDRALASGATVIGVNHRDLETLVIDVNAGERLIPLIPADRIAVAESGVASRRDVERLAAAGADAVLIGSFLSASDDPLSAVRTFTRVPRIRRG